MLKAESLSYEVSGKRLIDQISLEFKPGVLYGILGPNGSGKSTLLKNLTGIWKPSTGAVFCNGERLLNKPRREISRTISLVPQNPQVHFDFNVTEMVSMGRYSFGSPHCSNEVKKALITVDAWHLKDRSILHLSYGERKRVYIARALITESPIMLLDEPEANLDIRHQLEIWQLLQMLAQQGKTVIVTNHDLVATRRFCNEVAVLNQGRCLAHGAYEDVITKECLQTVFGVSQNHPDLIHHYDVCI
jgi:iron complex transport system ATP-binding protein